MELRFLYLPASTKVKNWTVISIFDTQGEKHIAIFPSDYSEMIFNHQFLSSIAPKKRSPPPQKKKEDAVGVSIVMGVPQKSHGVFQGKSMKIPSKKDDN